MPPTPEICVGAIVIDRGRLLLVQRGRGAAIGRWSVPGGRVEAGETLARAVEREVEEETALEVRCGEFLGWVERISELYHFVIMDFRADVVSDPEVLRAGDDADDAAWVPLDRLHEHDLVDGLLDFLRDHHVI